MDPLQQLEKKREVWRRDILRFCEDVLYWRTGSGVEKWTPYPEQARALKKATATDRRGRPQHKTVAFCWPKRQGKSTAAAAILAHSLVTGSNAHSVVCSNSRENAMTVTFEALLNFIRHSPILQALIPESERQRWIITCPAWNNWLRALPANENTVQGIAVTAGGWACFDDAHSAPLRVLDMVASQTENPQARVLVPSMMGSTRGYVYRLWEASKRSSGRHILFEYWHGERANRNPYVPKRWLAQRRAEVPPPVYAVLHENEPGEGGDALFDLGQLMACREQWRPPTTAQEWDALKNVLLGPRPSNPLPYQAVRGGPESVRALVAAHADPRSIVLGAGLDRSLGRGDDTVMAVVARYEDTAGTSHYAVVWCQALVPTEGAILEAAEQVRAIFGNSIAQMVVEIYQCADLAPKLRKTLNCTVELESASGQAQAGAFNELWQLVNEGRFHYPAAFERLHEQLCGFQINTDAHLPKFTGGSGDAVDDYVYATCWATVGARRGRRGGIRCVLR